MKTFLTSLFIAAGIAYAGHAVNEGLQKLNASNRVVTVKGLAEREVAADLVIWPISYVETGNELATLYTRVEANNKRVTEFLAANGIKAEDVSVSPPRINDNEANNYGSTAPRARYSVTVVATVRSSDMKAVQAAMAKSGELVKQGVAVSLNYDARPEYLFTKLNDIKPSLIAEATQNARKAAEQFASDSSSVVGGIRNANQGQITIVDRDSGTPEVKIVRVVSTVEYLLE